MISYAGITLLQTDPEGKLQAFLDRWQDLEETPVFGERAIAVESVRNCTRSDLRCGVGLPTPNYSPEPKRKLNTLYWPTGASRWATFYGLTNLAGLQAIYAIMGSSNVPATLRISDDDNVLTSMFLLPPRKISSDLFILPLVDQRYWWQAIHVGALALDRTTDWSDVFGAIETALGVSINQDAIDANYLVADWYEFQRQYQSIPVLFDAAASSVGQRVYVTFAGTVFCATHDTNPSSVNTGMPSGGNNAGNTHDLPGQLVVTFPKMKNSSPLCGGERYAITKNVGTGTTQLPIHSSCYADFTTGSGTPDNNSALNGLATIIAADYLAWRANRFDLSYASVKYWTFTGFEDFVEICFGAQIPDGTANVTVTGSVDQDNQFCEATGTAITNYVQKTYTRVVSMPYDFGVDQQLSQDSSLYILDRFQVGFTGSTITKGGHGPVAVYKVTGESLGVSVDAYDWAQNADPDTNTYPNGTRVLLWWDCPADKWVFGSLAAGTDADAVVQVTDGSTGTMVSVNGGCVWGGKLLTLPDSFANLCTNNWVQSEASIWIAAIDGVSGLRGDGSEDTVTTPQVFSGDRFTARKVGTFTYSSSTRDLYVIRTNLPASARFIKFTLYQTLNTTDASQANCTVNDYWNGPNPGSTVTVHNLAQGGAYKFSGNTNDTGYAVYDEIANKYKIFTLNFSGDNQKVVQVTGGSTGLMTSANAGCVWPGVIVNPAGSFSTVCDASEYSTGSNVWIFSMDKPGGSDSGVPPQLVSGDRFLGHLWGNYTVSSDTRPLYIIRSGLPKKARYIQFQLPSAMALTDTSKAGCSVLGFSNGPNPGSTVTVYNLLTNIVGRGQFKGFTNAIGYAIYDDLSDAYFIWHLLPPALIIEGTLNSDLTGTSVSGNTTNYYQGQTPGSVTIYDDQQFFVGAPAYSPFRAIYDDISQKYRLINARGRQGTRFFYAELSANLCCSDSSGSINDLSVYSFTGDAIPSVTSAYNVWSLAGTSGAPVMLVEDSSAGVGYESYYIAQVGHQCRTLMTDVFMSGNNINKKTRDFSIMSCQNSDAQSIAITGQAFTVVTDVFMSGNDLKEKKRQIITLTGDSSDTQSLIISGTTCT